MKRSIERQKEHIEKYRMLNKKYSIKTTVLPEGYTKQSLKEEVIRRAETNLNFIPLQWWDSHAVFMKVPGSSLSQRVCMLKQACLDYIFDGKDVYHE
jgi:hypothetical protein